MVDGCIREQLEAYKAGMDYDLKYAMSIAKT
jgi:hypothetical protein